MRDDFSQCKEEDAGGLAPVKDDDAAMQKISRIDVTLLDGFDYKCILKLIPLNDGIPIFICLQHPLGDGSSGRTGIHRLFFNIPVRLLLTHAGM